MTRGLRGGRGAGALVLAAAVVLAPFPAADARRGPAPPPVVPEVAVVGDSIGRDAKRNITETVEVTHDIAYFRAVAAGFIGYYLDETDFLDVVTAEGGPDIVVAELGTGDAFWDHSNALFRSDVHRFLDTVLPDVTCVVWINQKPTPTRAYPYVNEHQVAYNQILEDILLQPEYEDDVRLVDYAAWYRLAGDRYFLDDLLHHTAAGRREFGLLAGQGVVGCDPATASGPFWDVPNVHWAFDAISWVGTEGIASGYPNGAYRANLGSFKPVVTRVQMATMLWKLAGEPAATDGFENPWTDSPTWADPALDWLKQNAIVRGINSTQFKPNQTLTRLEAAMWVWRLAGEPVPTGTATWTDVPVSAALGLAWIQENGLMSGFDSEFRPDGPVTRAQAASVLYAYHLLPPPETPVEAAPIPAPTTTTAPPTTPAPPTTAAPATVPPPTTGPPTTF